MVSLDWRIILTGLVLLAFSGLAQAAYNPYINNGYDRPYYTQFYTPAGVPRTVPYYSSYGYSSYYSPYYYYVSPSVVSAPVYTVPTTVAYPAPVVYPTTVSYAARFGFSFHYYR